MRENTLAYQTFLDNAHDSAGLALLLHTLVAHEQFGLLARVHNQTVDVVHVANHHLTKNKGRVEFDFFLTSRKLQST